MLFNICYNKYFTTLFSTSSSIIFWCLKIEVAEGTMRRGSNKHKGHVKCLYIHIYKHTLIHIYHIHTYLHTYIHIFILLWIYVYTRRRSLMKLELRVIAESALFAGLSLPLSLPLRTSNEQQFMPSGSRHAQYFSKHKYIYEHVAW